jgi:threonine dehydrogenase-like Zn-dependent dehydrogenase
MGHEYMGIVEEVGSAVTTINPGLVRHRLVLCLDNTCPICRAGYQSSCVNRVGIGGLGAQAERLRVPLADSTLVATPETPPTDLPLIDLSYLYVYLSAGTEAEAMVSYPCSST